MEACSFTESLEIYEQEVKFIISKWKHISNRVHDIYLMLIKSRPDLVNQCTLVYQNDSESPIIHPDDHFSLRTIKELKQHDFKITQLYKTLDNLIRTPEITLAIAGTTSSGKSSLVDLLCGADIMPVHSQEISAGTVSIQHNTQSKKIHVKKTENAVWECGQWDNLTDHEIRARLIQIMSAYNNIRDENKIDQPIESPQVVINYPLRINQDIESFGLPKSFKFQLLDLPGLRHINDQGNSTVIRKAKSALCLVTYNSEETDETKQEYLLKQIVEQVKEFGGSPKRMLFVLNRIDAIIRDVPPSQYESEINKFVTKMTAKIKTCLANELPEYYDDIQEIQVTKLSTRPALYAHLIKPGNEQWVNYAKELDAKYAFLIPEEILDDLPRQTQKWDTNERAAVSDAVLKTSYASDFEGSLQTHIRNNLVELIFHQHLYSLRSKIKEAINWIRSLIYALKNSNEKKYQEEKQRIEALKIRVNNDSSAFADSFEEKVNTLVEYIGRSAEEADALGDLVGFLNVPEEQKKALLSKMNVLRELGTRFKNVINLLVDGIIEMFNNGDNKKINELLDLYGFSPRIFSSAIALIIDKSFQEISAGVFTSDNIDIPLSLRKKLDAFSLDFANSISELYRLYSAREQERINDVLHEIQQCYIEKLQNKFKGYLDENLIIERLDKKAEWRAPEWKTFNPKLTFNFSKKMRKWTFFGIRNKYEYESSDISDILTSHNREVEKDLMPILAEVTRANLISLIQNVNQKQTLLVEEYSTKLDETYFQFHAQSEQYTHDFEELVDHSIIEIQQELEQKLQYLLSLK